MIDHSALLASIFWLPIHAFAALRKYRLETNHSSTFKLLNVPLTLLPPRSLLLFSCSVFQSFLNRSLKPGTIGYANAKMMS